ncbi:MAG TPA: DNA polymerase ligase N-terminal domain-containing protein [Pilimelia sp.]|nr:DNA polymerase ligase N-terminal domain-containing protein [Pilimelia sp.]
MGDRLTEYRRKRDRARTPEPVPGEPAEPAAGRGDTFVVQQHHARRLHWDLRLERDGVLVSWAVPRGLPRDPARNHLAVHTEDHPMEYADFSGEIPAGEYGGGRMTIYDRGTYVTEKWRDDEVIVVLRGQRAAGRYVLFRTSGRDWMVHRMDGPPPGWQPMPEVAGPMRATAAGRLPAGDAWAFELAWAGLRALAEVSGGRLRLVDAGGADRTAAFPELRALAEALAPTECLLDGVVVAFDAAGRLLGDGPARRIAAGDTAAGRRYRSGTPAQYLAVDLLWLDGRATLEVPYAQRRELLAGLDVVGPHWQTPPHFAGAGVGAAVRAASRERSLPGVVAKRLDSPYEPGAASRSWRLVRNPPPS